jgi:lytic murein transglycosylase
MKRFRSRSCISLAFAVFLAALQDAAAGQPARDFQSCLNEVRNDAVGKGVRREIFDGALAGVEPDESVLEAMSYQPEFRAPIWDYLAGLVDARRIADGRSKLVEWESVLAAVEAKYGVDRHTVVAVWGVESDFGRVMGTRPLVRSLATVACNGSRQRFFRSELIDTLKIVQSGDFSADMLTGSWAGAFGQTQFMPSTYLRLAVDFDGDGRRDIVASVPDALASTANYLKRAGWMSGAPWGREVKLPMNYSGPSGRREKQSVAHWNALGIRHIDGSMLTDAGPAALLLPAGANGPAFLVFKNFDAIYSYNAAESYALAIAHLSDRLRGAGAWTTAWPTDDPGLSRDERLEVQQRLLALGYELGVADGMIGSKTRAAIRDYQTAQKMPADGRAGKRLLERLRAGASNRDTRPGAP